MDPADAADRIEQAGRYGSPGLEDARAKIEWWRLNYNRVRPHRTLGNLSPKEFVEAIT